MLGIKMYNNFFTYLYWKNHKQNTGKWENLKYRENDVDMWYWFSEAVSQKYKFISVKLCVYFVAVRL